MDEELKRGPLGKEQRRGHLFLERRPVSVGGEGGGACVIVVRGPAALGVWVVVTGCWPARWGFAVLGGTVAGTLQRNTLADG